MSSTLLTVDEVRHIPRDSTNWRGLICDVVNFFVPPDQSMEQSLTVERGSTRRDGAVSSSYKIGVRAPGLSGDVCRCGSHDRTTVGTISTPSKKESSHEKGHLGLMVMSKESVFSEIHVQGLKYPLCPCGGVEVSRQNPWGSRYDNTTDEIIAGQKIHFL